MEFLVDLVQKISLYSVSVEWCWVLGIIFIPLHGAWFDHDFTESEMFHSEKHTKLLWLLMAGVEFEYGYHIVNNFGGKKIWLIWQIVAIHQVFCQFSRFP